MTEVVDANSREKVKRDLAKVRDLATVLLHLTPGTFERLEMPDDLRAAMVEARRIKDRGPLKRQLQFATGLLARSDLKNALRARLRIIDHARLAPLPPVSQPADTLVDDLLEGGDPAVFALAVRYEPTELQTLRQAVRQARKQLTAGKAKHEAALSVRRCLDHIGGTSGKNAP